MDDPSKMKRKAQNEIQDDRVDKRAAKRRDIDPATVTMGGLATPIDSATHTASANKQNLANADHFGEEYQFALLLPEVDGADDTVVTPSDDVSLINRQLSQVLHS